MFFFFWNLHLNVCLNTVCFTYSIEIDVEKSGLKLWEYLLWFVTTSVEKVSLMSPLCKMLELMVETPWGYKMKKRIRFCLLLAGLLTVVLNEILCVAAVFFSYSLCRNWGVIWQKKRISLWGGLFFWELHLDYSHMFLLILSLFKYFTSVLNHNQKNWGWSKLHGFELVQILSLLSSIH